MSEIVLFGWLGYWLDSKLGTSLYVVIGFVFGLIMALVQLVLSFRKEFDKPPRGQESSSGGQDSR